MKIRTWFISKKYRKDIFEAVNEMSRDFPVLNSSNIIIHTKKLNRRLSKSFASHRNIFGQKIIHEIKLNPKFFLFSKNEYLLRTVADANYETIKDIIWHELGHVLQIYMLCDYYNLNLNDYNINEEEFINHLTNRKSNENCFEQHKKYILSTFDCSVEMIEQFLGSYSMEEPAEFIPECFNNYYRLKNKSMLDEQDQKAFKFVETVVDDYRKYIK